MPLLETILSDLQGSMSGAAAFAHGWPEAFQFGLWVLSGLFAAYEVH